MLFCMPEILSLRTLNTRPKTLRTESQTALNLELGSIKPFTAAILQVWGLIGFQGVSPGPSRFSQGLG